MSTEDGAPDLDETAPKDIDAAADDHADETSSNAEAARYRRRLRETEAERDALRTRVESFQRAEVERRIADALETPSDVWLSGVQLADIVNEDGEVDEHELDQVVLRVTTEHPGWRKRTRPGVDHDQGQRSDFHTPTWAALLGDRSS